MSKISLSKSGSLLVNSKVTKSANKAKRACEIFIVSSVIEQAKTNKELRDLLSIPVTRASDRNKVIKSGFYTADLTPSEIRKLTPVALVRIRTIEDVKRDMRNAKTNTTKMAIEEFKSSRFTKL